MEIIFQNFIKAFGWSILHSFWQCGIIYAILLASLLCFPKWPSRVRHNLSYLSICFMFVWFCITFIRTFTIQSNITPAVAFTGPALQQYAAGIDPSGISAKTEAYFPFVLIAYLTGIILQMIIILKGYYEVQRLRRTRLENIDAEWEALFNKITEKLDIRQKINFRVSSLVKTPVVVGYLKPLILFPVSLCSYLDTDQVEAILIHELTHIRRNDYLLNFIKTIIETVLFFNPFVWMASKFIEIEREHACDDMVLRVTGKPVTYAQALLKLEIFNKNPQYALAATGKTNHLLNRIKRITNMKSNYLNLKQQMAVLTLLLACFISFAWIRPTENKKARETAAQTKKLISDIAETGYGLNNFRYGQLSADTIPSSGNNKKNEAKKESNIKIVITDNEGHKKEYNSVKELPDSIRSNFEVFGNPGILFKTGDSVYFKEFNSKEWMQRQDEIIKKFTSPEWINKQKEMALLWEKKFNSPEWKKQQEDIAKKYGEVARKMTEKFNSPEWKKQQEDIAKKYSDVARKMTEKFNSPEWKKQQEEMAEKYADMAKKMAEKFKSTQWNNLQGMLQKLSSRNFNFYFDSLKFKTPDSSFYYFRLNPSDSLRYKIKRVFPFEGNSSFYYFHDQDAVEKLRNDSELRSSKEYKKLKEKFDKDVEKLRKKEIRKDKKQAEPVLFTS